LCLACFAWIPVESRRSLDNFNILQVGTDADGGGSCVATLQPLLRQVRFKEMMEAAMDWSWGGSFQDSEYERQWKDAASKEKVLDGSNLTWGEASEGKGYIYERKRLTLMGRLEDSRRHIVINTTVRGVCDASILGLRFLGNLPALLVVLRDMLPKDSACAGKDLKEMAVDAGDALSAECLDSCLGSLSENTKDFECKAGQLTQEFYQQVVDDNEQCAAMPLDNLERLSMYAMRLKCFTFHSPHPLFLFGDKAAGQVSQMPGEPTQVCTLPEEANATKDKSNIVQRGVCPEGSKCKCPMKSLRDRQTAMQIRLERGQHLWTKAGAASLPVITKQYATGFLVSTVVVKMGIQGMAASAALAATLDAPMFLIMGTLKLSITALFNWAKFQCADTLGCWPQAPEDAWVEGTPKACRLPAKAKDGGSPVWFLPPPGLRMHHSKGKCILNVCKTEDYLAQRVGLGRSVNDWRYDGNPNVYNCQPLAFEEMTRQQKSALLIRLNETGVSEEYDITGLLSQYPLDDTTVTTTEEETTTTALDLDQDVEAGELFRNVFTNDQQTTYHVGGKEFKCCVSSRTGHTVVQDITAAELPRNRTFCRDATGCGCMFGDTYHSFDREQAPYELMFGDEHHIPIAHSHHGQARCTVKLHYLELVTGKPAAELMLGIRAASWAASRVAS
jgi:hypothetical protein